MAKTVGCTLGLRNVKSSILPQQSSKPVGIIELRTTLRYQLLVPSNVAGVNILIEDIVTPPYCSSFEVPCFFFSQPSLHELYISDIILSSMNVDPNVRQCLSKKIALFAMAMLLKDDDQSYTMVADLGIRKVELMSKEEADRIAAELIVKTDNSENLSSENAASS